MNKSQDKPKVTHKGKVALMILLVVAVISLLSLFVYNSLFRNLAKEAANPLESSLLAAGAVKKCSAESNGRGPDDRTPWYSAIYEVPKDQEATIFLIKQAAKDNGFDVAETRPDINVQDNRFFTDNTNKKSTDTSLENGNVDLDVTMYGSKEYNSGDRFCTVKDSTDKSKTTFGVQVTLPDYR